MNIIQHLPANPTVGTEVKFLLANSNDTINFNFNGLPYLGDNTNINQHSLNQPLEVVSLIYIDTQIGWIPSRKSIISIQSNQAQ